MNNRRDNRLRLFFGVAGVIDEHVLAVIGAAATDWVMVALSLQLVTFVVGGALFTLVSAQAGFLVLMCDMMLEWVLLAAWMHRVGRREGITTVTVTPAQLAKARRASVVRPLLSAALASPLMLVSGCLLDNGGTHWSAYLGDWRHWLQAVLVAVGIGVYGLVMRKRAVAEMTDEE